MSRTNLFLLLLVFLAGTSCNKQQHFISDDAFRAEVEKDFQAKQAALPNGNLFSVFNQQMTPDEKEALTFLYAYMPIGDITDYDGQLYLDNIRSSFRARVEMPWGDSIPEDIFRHFVLPVRVNNENLDESRMVFYEELKDRVKGLSLYDAVLEVNHWCHEKVIYTPSDARTSSPLASVKTAYGRCGEESTFTVAALRSVGIPARQVYTPRWARTGTGPQFGMVQRTGLPWYADAYESIRQIQRTGRSHGCNRRLHRDQRDRQLCPDGQSNDHHCG